MQKLAESLGCVGIVDNDDLEETNERLVKIVSRMHRTHDNKTGHPFMAFPLHLEVWVIHGNLCRNVKND